MKSLVFFLLVVHACLASEDLFHEDKLKPVCESFDHLEIEIGGAELQCGGNMDYGTLNSGSVVSLFFRYKKAHEKELYMIIAVDADEPGCKSKLHYMISNIPGDKLAAGDTSTKDVFSVYFAPYLPRGSPVHRYFIYAFKQTNPLADLVFPSRCDFDLKGFVDGQSLKLVAANMFKTQNS